MYWVAIVGQRGAVIVYSLEESRVDNVVERDANLIVFEAELVTEQPEDAKRKVKIVNDPELWRGGQGSRVGDTDYG